MSITGTDLIHSSFRLIGAIAAGETLETNELNDALVSLNQLISSWNTEGLTLAGRLDINVGLSAGTNRYTLAVRPGEIVAAMVFVQGVECPLQLIDAVGWAAITEHGTTAQTTQKLFCDYQYPNSNVYVWPTPKVSALLDIWTNAIMGPFTSLSYLYDLPPGYEAALRYNFAIDVAPEYGRPLDQTVIALAQQFKASIVQLNTTNHMKTAQPAAAALAAQGTQ
jgi:hypothetical protein